MTPVRVAVLLIVVCLVAAWQVTVIPESLMQMTVGPVVAPAAIVGGFALVSVLYGISALRGRQVDESLDPEQSPLPGATARLVYLLAGGAVFIATVTHIGFILPGTACGMCIARAFDAPLSPKSALVCGGIATAFWTLFAQILGVGLGPALPFGF